MATSASERGSSLHAYHDYEANDVEMKTLGGQHRGPNDDEETQFMIGGRSKREAEEKRNVERRTFFRKLILFSVLVSIATGILYLYHPIRAKRSNEAALHHGTSEEATELEGTMLATKEVTSAEPTYFPTKDPATASPMYETAEPTYFPSQGTLELESTAYETNSSDVKQLQISNYIAGKALILNIHITHHAGTSVCVKMSQLGPTPSFACMKKKSGDNSPWPAYDPNINKFSISYDDASTLVQVFRPYFHFMAMEYPRWGNLHNANWEYENLVSMIVMRNPLDRFLAGGKCGRFHNSLINEADPEPSEEVQRLFWEYANDGCADNYALRVLANSAHCNEGNMNECFESAKSLLQRFTFILDEDCLDEGMEAMGAQLHLDITSDSFESHLHHEHTSAQERIHNDTLYEFLLDKFHYDIALYEWSKNMSIVKCTELVKA
ncbi:hypothetical protein ACHAW6_005022 [Cyclotella cf. meneghiniana]